MAEKKQKKQSAGMRLQEHERGSCGMTVTLPQKVKQFREIGVFFRLPFGLRIDLTEKDYILIVLPSTAFASGDRASLSVYLTRQGMNLAARCPKGTKLMVEFLAEPAGGEAMHTSSRRPELYSKTTGH